MNLKREININKKLILTLLIINVLVIGIGYSYALFQITIIKNDVVRLQATTIDITLTSSDLIDNKTLTLSANETKSITITLTNESITNVKVGLYYIGSTDITFKSETTFIDENNMVIGEIQEGSSVEMTLEITNNASSSVEVELGVQGGLVGYELVLESGRNNVILKPSSAASLIMSKLGTGGLVAVNTSGTLYTGSGTIREYRYSGATANNYVIFNDDGDATVEDNELWRIVGVFKNSSGDWNLKLMRVASLTSSEISTNYTYNSVKYVIGNSSVAGLVYWNYDYYNIAYNDWTTAGLQYFLNNSYYSTFTTKAKDLISKNYTYYLGNFSNWDDTVTTYTKERTSSNVWNTSGIKNPATWKGAIALLYASDYGYSADSSYWSNVFLGTRTTTDWPTNYGTASSSSWIYKNNSEVGFFINPSGASSGSGTYATYVLDVQTSGTYPGTITDSNGVKSNSSYARPVLNLVATAEIEDASGTKSDPYRIIE